MTDDHEIEATQDVTSFVAELRRLADAQAALEAFDKAWAAAGEKGDAKAMAAFYSDDYQGLSPGGSTWLPASSKSVISSSKSGQVASSSQSQVLSGNKNCTILR